MTKILSFANHKGGVAKSTSTANIGAALAQNGQRVLLIDLDPQANLSLGFGVKNSEKGVYGALLGRFSLHDTKLNIKKGLDLIPSSLSLCGAEIELSSESGREFILKELLDPIKNDYDYVLIDCPPSLGLLTLNALTAANEVYIPMQAQFLAMQGVSALTEVISKIQMRLNPKLKIGGVFLTQFDNRKILNRDTGISIENFFKSKVFKTRIRDNVALAECPAAGKDIFTYAPKSAGAADYMALTKELLARSNNE